MGKKCLPSGWAGVSLSHATMQPEHLFDAFLTGIQQMPPKLAGRTQVIQKCSQRIESGDYECTNAFYDLEDVFDWLCSIAPRGCYFGSHPGNGSDYGFWEMENE